MHTNQKESLLTVSSTTTTTTCIVLLQSPWSTFPEMLENSLVKYTSYPFVLDKVFGNQKISWRLASLISLSSSSLSFDCREMTTNCPQVNWSLTKEADHFLYPPAAFGYTICNLSSVDMFIFCHELSPALLIFRHSKDVSREAQLTLLYSVDERLGVCHLMDLCISHMINVFDAQHDL